MKGRTIRKLLPLWLVFVVLTLNSCFGLAADITMNRDGSGKISLEYRISRAAEAIGRLDGNERWQIIPAGRADFERTLARIPDMRLVSFSTREEPSPKTGDRDIVNKVELEFKNTEALLAFLDPSGKRAVLVREGDKNRLSINLNEGVSPQANADLLDLLRQVSDGYELEISFSTAGDSALALSDSRGNAIQPPDGSRVVLSGKKVSLKMGTGQVIGLRQGLAAHFLW
ncbi:MAG: hypothetical protein LBU85_02815 [Treponema sp.]|jgi:hypothetical protein|nr:hypothetical protein [Treponema sp.]